MLTGPQHPGILDGEVYRRLASDARANGVIVVADLTGEPLPGALDGGVDLLKLSDSELEGEGFGPDRSPDALLRAAQALSARGRLTS